MYRLCFLIQKSEITLQPETTRRKWYHQRENTPEACLSSLCHHFTQYYHSWYADLIGHHGSNLWHDVANKLIDKYKCPKCLVISISEEHLSITPLFDKCKVPWKLLGHCSLPCTPTCQDYTAGVWGLFPKVLWISCYQRQTPNPEGTLGTPGKGKQPLMKRAQGSQ